MVDIVSRTQDTALTVVIQEPNGLLQQAWVSMGSVWSGPYTLGVDPTSAPGEPGCKSSRSLQTTCKLNRWTPMIPPEVLQGWRFGPLLYIEDIIHIAPFKSIFLWLWFANVARIQIHARYLFGCLLFDPYSSSHCHTWRNVEMKSINRQFAINSFRPSRCLASRVIWLLSLQAQHDQETT